MENMESGLDMSGKYFFFDDDSLSNKIKDDFYYLMGLLIKFDYWVNKKLTKIFPRLGQFYSIKK